MKRLSLAVLVVALATGVLGQVSLKSTAPPTGGGGGGLAFSAASQGTQGYGPISFNHTITGSNTLLIVGVAGANFQVHWTCTFDSVSMTEVAYIEYDTTLGLSMFRLVAPHDGEHAVSCDNAGGGRINGGAISFTGANQSNPIRASNTAAANTVSVTSAVGDIVVDAFMGSSFSTLTVGDGQTKRYDPLATDDPYRYVAGSHKDGAAGSVSMSWTLTGTDPVIIAASIQPQ